MLHSMRSDLSTEKISSCRSATLRGAERNIVLSAVAGAHAQDVRDEIELHVEPSIAVRDRRTSSGRAP